MRRARTKIASVPPQVTNERKLGATHQGEERKHPFDKDLHPELHKLDICRVDISSWREQSRWRVELDIPRLVAPKELHHLYIPTKPGERTRQTRNLFSWTQVPPFFQMNEFAGGWMWQLSATSKCFLAPKMLRKFVVALGNGLRQRPPDLGFWWALYNCFWKRVEYFRFIHTITFSGG